MFFKIVYLVAQPLLRLFFRMIFFARVSGKENILKEGGFIVSSNHKSNFDPVLIAAFLPRRMNFLAKRELFGNKFFGWFLKGVGVVPITRGNAEIGTLKAVISLLKKGGIFTIFPQGTRTKNADISNVKPGAVIFAIKGQVPIQPVLIEGDYKPFRGVRLKFGKPIYFSEYYDKKMTQDELYDLSVSLMKHIYGMSGENK